MDITGSPKHVFDGFAYSEHEDQMWLARTT